MSALVLPLRGGADDKADCNALMDQEKVAEISCLLDQMISFFKTAIAHLLKVDSGLLCNGQLARDKDFIQTSLIMTSGSLHLLEGFRAD
jgi:hypothetical protein